MIHPRSIGFRLALWYSSIMAVALVLFAVGVRLAMERSIRQAVDNVLRDRVADARLVIEQHIYTFSREDFQEEIGAHLLPEPDNVLLRVSDERGGTLYESRPLDGAAYPFYAAQALAGGMRYDDSRIHHEPLRVLSARLSVRGRSLVIQAAVPVREWIEGLAHLSVMIAGSIPLILILAALGGFWMSRRALAPVDQIIDTARSIGASDLGLRLRVPKSGDELERLSTTLNGMFERLDVSFRRTRQFTADASHELRTPLALMTTTAELALRKKRPDSEYREALAQISSELRRTSRFVEDLLLLARADAGVHLNFANIDARDPFSDACEQGKVLAEHKGLSFEFTQPDQPIEIRAVSDSIRRLFLILIENAVKYTAEGGCISVSLVRENASAIVHVKDSGTGIAGEDLPRIFDRFYRADKARSSETGGAGLGLAIADWIVHAHGGNIQVKSRPGEGSVFTIVLPAQPDTSLV